MNNRHTLRQHYLSLRATLSPSLCLAHGQAITDQIIQQPFYQQAQKLAFYHAIRGEVDLSPLLAHSLTEGKECYLPCVVKETNTLVFRLYDPQIKMQKNHYGIHEPHTHHPHLDPCNLDGVFVPLVAFDLAGHRLGMGAGYYDRTFAFEQQSNIPKPWLIGIAHSIQRTQQIPSEPWDIPLHLIITEQDHFSVHPMFKNWKE